VRVNHQSSSGGIRGGVCSVGWLCLLLFLLLLFAQATFRWLVRAPCHMMLTPMLSVLAHLLTFLVSILGRDLFPCLVLFLLFLFSRFLLVLCLLIATFSLSFALAFAFDNISELVIRTEMSLESIELSQHGHNLLVTRRFGSPSSLSLQIVALAGGKGHEGFMGDFSELPIKPVIMVVADELLEVVAGDGTVGIKQEPYKIVNGGATGQQLQMISVKLATDLIDVTINCRCKNSKVLKVLLQGLRGGNGSMVASCMMILYIRGAYSTPLKVYSLR
jgi:hypothetical protein